nr:hypothetical protein CKG001_10060 [Bdellovibrio sp. CKG001]
MTDGERIETLELMVRDLKIQVTDLQFFNIFLRQTIEDIRREHKIILPHAYRNELDTEREYVHKDAVMSGHIRKHEARLKLPVRGK